MAVARWGRAESAAEMGEQAARLFKSMTPERVQAWVILARCPEGLTALELADWLSVDEPRARRALRFLVNAGVAQTNPAGDRWRFYPVVADRVARLVLGSPLPQPWDVVDPLDVPAAAPQPEDMRVVPGVTRRATSSPPAADKPASRAPAKPEPHQPFPACHVTTLSADAQRVYDVAVQQRGRGQLPFDVLEEGLTPPEAGSRSYLGDPVTARVEQALIQLRRAQLLDSDKGGYLRRITLLHPEAVWESGPGLLEARVSLSQRSPWLATDPEDYSWWQRMHLARIMGATLTASGGVLTLTTSPGAGHPGFVLHADDHRVAVQKPALGHTRWKVRLIGCHTRDGEPLFTDLYGSYLLVQTNPLHYAST